MIPTASAPHWCEYLRLIAPPREYTQVEVVERVLALGKDGVTLNQTTVSNWRRGRYSPPRSRVVAAVAEAFGREPLEALVAAGHVDVEWVSQPLSSSALSMLQVVGIIPVAQDA